MAIKPQVQVWYCARCGAEDQIVGQPCARCTYTILTVVKPPTITYETMCLTCGLPYAKHFGFQCDNVPKGPGARIFVPDHKAAKTAQGSAGLKAGLSSLGKDSYDYYMTPPYSMMPKESLDNKLPDFSKLKKAQAKAQAGWKESQVEALKVEMVGDTVQKGGVTYKKASDGNWYTISATNQLGLDVTKLSPSLEEVIKNEIYGFKIPDKTGTTTVMPAYIYPTDMGDPKALNGPAYYLKAGIDIQWDAEKLESDMPKKLLKLCAACEQIICNVCLTCHEPTCLGRGKWLKTKSDLIKQGVFPAKTQKARGYVVLSKALGELSIPSPYLVIQDEGDIKVGLEALENSGGWGYKSELFVRPCPVRPRHGFVESRGVIRDVGNIPNLIEDIKKIWLEARAADPEAELLIMPRVDATHNMVVSPTMLAVGKGHDGATAGRQSLMLPLMGTQLGGFEPELLLDAGIDPATEDPYFEAVLRGGAPSVVIHGPELQLTQIRAGAKIPGTVDFIPTKVRVEQVIVAEGDLLEWETKVKGLGQGVVVDHVGGTLISHYGMHCIFNKIPVLTSRTPIVGEILEPTTVLPDLDPAAVRLGLGWGTMVPLSPLAKPLPHLSAVVAAKLLLMVAHNAAAMSGAQGKWLGIATAFMLRLGLAASHGEARHAKGWLYHNQKKNRETVYTESMADFWGSRKKIMDTQDLFLHFRGWGGNFGGKAWAQCTEALIALEQSAQSVVKNPTMEGLIAMVDSLHRAIKQAHNGGWWLNKFVLQEVFDGAAQQDVILLANAGAVAYEVEQAIKGIGQADLDSWLTRWADATALEQVIHDPARDLGNRAGPSASVTPGGYYDKDDADVSDSFGDDEEDETYPKPGCECLKCMAAIKAAKQKAKLDAQAELGPKPKPISPPSGVESVCLGCAKQFAWKIMPYSIGEGGKPLYPTCGAPLGNGTYCQSESYWHPQEEPARKIVAMACLTCGKFYDFMKGYLQPWMGPSGICGDGSCKGTQYKLVMNDPPKDLEDVIKAEVAKVQEEDQEEAAQVAHEVLYQVLEPIEPKPMVTFKPKAKFHNDFGLEKIGVWAPVSNTITVAKGYTQQTGPHVIHIQYQCEDSTCYYANSVQVEWPDLMVGNLASWSPESSCMRYALFEVEKGQSEGLWFLKWSGHKIMLDLGTHVLTPLPDDYETEHLIGGLDSTASPF